MISLERLRKPRGRRLDSGIHEKFHGPLLRANSLELLETHQAVLRGTVKKKDEFKSGKWGHAKKRLLKETHEKCAYCETPTAVVDYGDVEHYRPKSIYWWLAYCVDNYLVSCAICNQKFKSNKFPILGSRLAAPTVTKNTTAGQLQKLSENLVPDPLTPSEVNSFLEIHDNEITLLVNPYIDDPADYFAWHADMVLEEVELVPANENTFAPDCVKAAIDVYGLNRSQLRRARYDTFESYINAKMNLIESGLSAAGRTRNERLVKRMLLDRYPYSGMIRFFESVGSIEEIIRQKYLTVSSD